MRIIEYDPNGGAVFTRVRFILPCVGASRIWLMSDPDGDGWPQELVRVVKRGKKDGDEREDVKRLVGRPDELAGIENPAIEWAWMATVVSDEGGEGAIELHVEQDGELLTEKPIELPPGHAEEPGTFSPFTFAFLAPRKRG